MTQKKVKEQVEQNSNLLAKAYPLQELKGWISKQLLVPPGKTGIAVFMDGKTELYTSGENQVITDLDRLMGKGAGFWAGYIPAENFNASISVTNLLSGDDKLLDLNILCDVTIKNEKKFFLDVVVPQREIPNQTFVVDMPEVFTSFATLIRSYSADDLVGGLVDEDISRKAQTLLTVTLPGKGIRLENVSLISIWNQEDRIAIEEKLFILDKKMKDLDFEKQLAEVENKEELDQLLRNSGIQLPHQATILPMGSAGENQSKIKDWIQGLTNDDQPGHNFRLKSLLVKKEFDSASPKKNPILKNWWVPRIIWMLVVILGAIGATFYLNQASEKIKWIGQAEFYVAIWMFALGVLIESVSKLFKQWESFFADVEKPSNILGLDNVRFKDKGVIDQIVREQSKMELSMQHDILNELRSRVYRLGSEDLALEMKRIERKLENFIPKISDTNIGRPVYLREDVKLSKTGWNLLMDEEEILLVKAALLSEETQSLQAIANIPDQISSKISDYETKLDLFTNAFIGRERILHSESIN